MAKKITLNSIKKLTPEEVGKMPKDEVSQYLQRAREEYTKREKTFNRNPIVYSRPFEKMKAYYEDKGMQSLSTMSRNKEIAELIRLQEMFTNPLSTVKNAREANIEEDKKLFGFDQNGRPKLRMNQKTRTLFWSAYDEFVHQNPDQAAQYPSDFIHQYLGEVVIDSIREGSLDLGSLVTKLSRYLRTGEMREEDSEINDTVAYRKARLNRTL